MTGETDLLGEGDIVALEHYVPDTRWNVSVTQRRRVDPPPRNGFQKRLWPLTLC